MWRKRGERFQDAIISEHDRYGGGSIMVWAGISRGGRTDLHIVMRGIMTGVRYRDEILDVYVRPYAGAIGPQFILMDDNARPHRAGWLRTTCSRRPSSIWTGQHGHLISTRSSMFGTCYRWRFCDVQFNQELSWNWGMPSLKSGTILRWQPSRDSLEA